MAHGAAASPQPVNPETRAPGESDGRTEHVAAPLDLTSPQLTLRALATGVLLGGSLSLCNIYAGLKVGWGFNMSITAALIGFGFWNALAATLRTRPFGLLENNINQTAASAGANISSAGLVSAMPALTMLTGQTLSWGLLAVWTFAVSLVGIVVAVGLRRQMLLVDKLPFPSGIAAAETLKEMYAKGAEALARVKHLAGAGLVASAIKVLEVVAKVPKLGLPGSVGLGGQAKVASASLYNLTFAFEPTLMMVGVGAIIGIRTGISLLVGAVVAWGVVAPAVLERGWAQAGAEAAPWFGPLNGWLLWPGVAMMVTASLTSFAFSWRSIVAAVRGASGAGAASDSSTADMGDVSRSWFLRGLAVALVLAVTCQVFIFDIGVVLAIFAVALTFGLAVVAGRVSGETAITPVGPMGKVTQLLFGVLAPGNPVANLMAANVTGGAASQTGDLLHDLKTGLLLGAKARLQALAQLCGAMAGALVGSAAYLVLVPDPKAQLLTEEWPAPAAAAWKGVAEVFMKGLESMPAGTVMAMSWAGGLGVVLAVAEKRLPKKVARWVPSPASLGLAFVIPAWNSMSMFLGAVLGFGVTRFFAAWSARFLIVVAAGIIAGESLTGVVVAMQRMFFP